MQYLAKGLDTKGPKGRTKSKMADENYESIKRARLCYEAASDEEYDASHDCNKTEQDYDELKRCPTEERRPDQKINPTSDLSREQDGGKRDSLHHESPENDDFPCTSEVENNVKDSKTEEFLPIAGPMGWIQRQMMMGVSAREVLSHMFPRAELPPDMSEAHMWKIVIEILSEPTPREKLSHVNTLDDVVGLLQKSKNIIVLTGAGVSVSCGIPDFRSHNGIYARLSEEYPDLPDPQSMFSIEYFFQNPRPFFKFAKEIYPGQFKPSLGHRFIRQLETNGQLLRNYSQNIDTLEQVAGISRVLQCHGSFSTASCTRCQYQVTGDVIKDEIFSQVIPKCPRCPHDDDNLAIMKPDIVFFGESLPAEFYKHLDEDVDKADLVIVIGSSLKVRPVALIPNHVPSEIPQVLINREPLRHLTFDVELLGDCDAIVAELCERLGTSWTGILQGFKVPPVDRDLLSHMETPSHSESDEEKVIFTLKEMESEHLEPEDKSVGIGIQQIMNDKEASGPSYSPHTPADPLASRSRHTHAEPMASTSGHTHADPLVSTSGHTRADPLASTSGHRHTDPLVSTSGHTHADPLVSTSAESSSSEETVDQSNRKQPEAAHSCYDRKIDSQDLDEELPTFLFVAPSRYMFHGAEVHSDSPLPSHGSNEYLSSDSNSDSESSSGSPINPATANQQEADVSGYVTESCSSDPMMTSSANPTDEKLVLITGGLSSYSCASQENSRDSSVDPAEFLMTAPQQAVGLDDIHPFFDPVMDDVGIKDPRLKPEGSGGETPRTVDLSAQVAVADGIDKNPADDLSAGPRREPPNGTKELSNSLPDSPS